jgi:outer membrane protein OmpA-like peptidoglycan-associated protein
MQKHLVNLLTLTMTCILSTSCSNHHPSISQQVEASWAKKLQRNHIQLAHLHNNWTFIIPITRFFTADGKTIFQNKRSVLKTMAQLTSKISHYTHNNNPIKITGYTNEANPNKITQRKTLQQTRAVAAFLWTEGFKRQQLIISSKPSNPPIANPNTVDGQTYNRRIEVNINSN